MSRLKKLIKNWIKEGKNNSFTLIGRRHLHSNNSWMHNSKRLVKGDDRCTLLINSKDAHSLKIEDGQIVTVLSDVGKIKLPIKITNEMMEKVVSIPHGWGHDKIGTDIKVAQDNPGVSLNDLTNHLSIDILTGNANFSGTRVSIET